SVGGRRVYPAEVERFSGAPPGSGKPWRWASGPAPRPGGGGGGGGQRRLQSRRSPGRESLAPHKVPRRLRIVSALPRNARGKLDRGRIRRLLEEHAPGRGIH